MVDNIPYDAVCSLANDIQDLVITTYYEIGHPLVRHVCDVVLRFPDRECMYSIWPGSTYCLGVAVVQVAFEGRLVSVGPARWFG